MKTLKIMAVFLTIFLTCCWAQSVFAAGPHDENCMDCHNIHYAKGNFIFGAAPNTELENPATSRTSAVVQGVDSLCLGCHNDNEGIIPIHLSTTHPTGVTPSYVNVPEKLLVDGQFSCISCHNPHPSNTNYKYLIVDTTDGTEMGTLCAVCHTEQSDTEVTTTARGAELNLGPRSTPRIAVSN